MRFTSIYERPIIESTPVHQHNREYTMHLRREALRFRFCGFGQVLVRFFGFSTRLKTAVFLVFVSCVVECFLWFCLWYSVLVNNALCILRFFWFCQGRYIPYNRTKTLVPKEHLELEERTACQVSLAAINGQADFEKVKISLKQNTFFQYHAAGIISCVLWP